MSNELDPIIRLGRRLRDETKGIGLSMTRFSVEPNLDGDVHDATAMFFMDDEIPGVSGEPDPEFDALIQGQLEAERNAKAAQARKSLENMREDLRDPRNGLGFDE
jgi:hypothetical protein